jgi:hypothetical protein
VANDLTAVLSESQELAKEIQRQDKAKQLPGTFLLHVGQPPGLPDFSWYTKPKPEKMNTKCTKWS